MYNSVPSSSGGMNSLPMRCNGIQLTMSAAHAAAITGQRLRSTKAITGS